jgi:hypothetical protein
VVEPVQGRLPVFPHAPVQVVDKPKILQPFHIPACAEIVPLDLATQLSGPGAIFHTLHELNVLEVVPKAGSVESVVHDVGQPGCVL